MEYNLIISNEAEDETKHAVDYYDEINPDLGTRFLAELRHIYNQLKSSPQLYSFVSANRKSNIRDVSIKSFPYVVIYEIRNSNVMIISVANTHMNPRFT